MDFFPIWMSLICCASYFIDQPLQGIADYKGLEQDFLALFLILGAKNSAFLIKHDVSCQLFRDAFYQAEEVPLYSQFAGNFYHEWMLDFFKCFPCIFCCLLRLLYCFCPSFYYMLYHIHLLLDVKSTLNYWDKAKLAMPYKCLYVAEFGSFIFC